MVGQNKLIRRLNSYTFENFPKSNLLIGEKGCGKHSLVQMACNKLNVPAVEITYSLSDEFITDLYTKTERVVYIIDINALAKNSRYLNKENAILKFVEEPPMDAIVFILVEYDSQVIDTIKNRCIIWQFKPYDLKTLKEFKTLDNDLIYSLLNTPGKLLNYETDSDVDYVKLIDICKLIIDNIDRANISNTLSLDRHLENFSLEDFLKCLKLLLYNNYIESEFDNKYWKAFELTKRFINRSIVLNINEQQMFDEYLLRLKQLYD